MKKRNLVLTLLLFSFVSSLKAQNCDPWIKQSYNLLYKRTPTAAECNIKNYNNGSWGSLAELIGYVEGYNRNKPGNFIKGDPWIFQAYYELYNRIPFAIELNVNLYNGGSWNNYGELKKYIQDFQTAAYTGDLRLVPGTVQGKDAAAVVDKNNPKVPQAVSLVSTDGGQVISPGGGNVISAGGGNIFTPANVISPGGGNVISPGGGNMTFSNNTAGLNVSGGYSTQSTGAKKVIKMAGKGSIVIK